MALATLLPAALVGVFLALLLGFEQRHSNRAQIEARAGFFAEQIAALLSNDVFAATDEQRKRLLDAALEQPGVTGIQLVDLTGTALLSSGRTDGPSTVAVRAPVFASSASEAARGKRVGTLVVLADTAASTGFPLWIWLVAGAGSGAVLVTAYVFVYRRGQRWRGALTQTRRNLARMRRGNLAPSPALPASGFEFARLAADVNATARALESSQTELLATLEQTTRDLKGTFEEMEEKSIELDLARRRALQSSRAKSEFLANMSHEIRTPMNAIMGHAHLLATTPLAGAQPSYLATIQDAANSLLALIDDILDIARLDANRVDLREQPFSLRDCATRVVEMLAPTAYEKGLDCYLIYAVDEPDAFIGDARRVRQILTNLLGNAIKFTQDGDVRVSLHAEPIAAARCALQLDVVDSGRGIGRDDQARLFQPFNRIESADRATPGTGLGLAICRQLCEAMGGRISVDSVVGRGSKFCAQILLDLHRLESASAANVNTVSVTVFGRDPQYRDTLTGILRAAGNTVIPAASRTQLKQVALRQRTRALVAVLDRATLDDEHELATLAAQARKFDRVVALASSADPTTLGRLGERFGGIALPNGVAPARLLQLVAGEPAGARVAAATEIGMRAGGGDRPILVADDDPHNRSYLGELLRRRGVEYLICEDGNEAVRIASGQALGMVLMDLRMPRLDGIAATRALRAREATARLPIIGMTASALGSEREAFLDAGGDECLVKPVPADWLYASLRHWRIIDAQREPDDAAADAALDAETRDLLLAELPQQLLAMRGALAAGAGVELRELAHKLCGTAAVFRFSRLETCARELEDAAYNGSAKTSQRLVAVGEQVTDVLRRLRAAGETAVVSDAESRRAQ